MYNKEYIKRYYEKNKEKIKAWQKEYSKEYKKKNREKINKQRRAYMLEYHFIKHYNITRAERDAMYDVQHGYCALCGEHKDMLCVDHCHDTSKIRELLCRNCNRTLGIIESNISLIYTMLAYLDKHK
jgi:hypothetical protein